MAQQTLCLLHINVLSITLHWVSEKSDVFSYYLTYVTNILARKTYAEKLMKEPKKAISKQDKVISDTCENILKIQNTFSDIRPPSVGKYLLLTKWLLPDIYSFVCYNVK